MINLHLGLFIGEFFRFSQLLTDKLSKNALK